MEILRHSTLEGYPADYLLSRLRGKRSRLLRDWDSAVHSDNLSGILKALPFRHGVHATEPAGLFSSFSHEYEWVYLQMETDLRSEFLPFFLFHEAEKTIIPCLRHLEKNDTGADTGKLLSLSLLSPELKSVLRERSLSGTVHALEGVFGKISPHFVGLHERLVHDGRQETEHMLWAACIRFGAATSSHPVIRDFFIDLADTLNLIAACKHLRWELDALPSFVDCGNFDRSLLSSAFRRKDTAGISDLISRYSGIRELDPLSGNMETLLLGSLTERIRTRGKDPLGTSLVLDYLWRCRLHAMNLNTIMHGKLSGRKITMKEMIG